MIDGCAGRFELTASDTLRRIEVTAVAEPESFVELSVPTLDGYLPGASESFSASIEVDAYLRVGSDEEIWIDTFEFDGGALEFGSGYRCDPQPPSYVQ